MQHTAKAQIKERSTAVRTATSTAGSHLENLGCAGGMGMRENKLVEWATASPCVLVTQTRPFSLFWTVGLTKIPVRTDLAANWTTRELRSILQVQYQPAVRNWRVWRVSGPAVTVAEATMKETAGRNVRLICGLQTFLHDCPRVVFCLTVLSPLVYFTNETDSAPGTDGGPHASKPKRLAMTQMECWWNWSNELV